MATVSPPEVPCKQVLGAVNVPNTIGWYSFGFSSVLGDSDAVRRLHADLPALRALAASLEDEYLKTTLSDLLGPRWVSSFFRALCVRGCVQLTTQEKDMIQGVRDKLAAEGGTPYMLAFQLPAEALLSMGFKYHLQVRRPHPQRLWAVLPVSQAPSP